MKYIFILILVIGFILSGCLRDKGTILEIDIGEFPQTMSIQILDDGTWYNSFMNENAEGERTIYNLHGKWVGERLDVGDSVFLIEYSGEYDQVFDSTINGFVIKEVREGRIGIVDESVGDVLDDMKEKYKTE